MKIKNTTVESTPFVDLDITDKAHKGKTIFWARLYWSERAGTYGRQVCYGGNDMRKTSGFFEGITHGCGYSKPCRALQDVLALAVGKLAYTSHYEAHNLLYKYHKGGNYYELSLSQLKKVYKNAR